MVQASRSCVLATCLMLAGCGGEGGPTNPSNGGANGQGGKSASAAGHAGNGGTNSVGGNASSTGGKQPNAAGDAGASGGPSEVPTSADCVVLPAVPHDSILVMPAQANELPSIVKNAAAGSTIALADGTYKMTGSDEAARRIQITKSGITLRSVSGKAAAVVLDGEYQTNELITINASDVTVANLTLLHAVDHAVHVMGGPTANITGARLTNLRIVDAGEQFVKVNPSGGNPNTYADQGILECSLLEMTADGRPHVEPNPGGCYTGGIDAHSARDWIVRMNTFRGIYCEGTGLAEHAVHFWSASRGTLVERNTIADCARGIGFGLGDGSGAGGTREYADNPAPNITGYVGHYDGVIRNNWISISDGLEFFDTGIELEQAHGARVLHNTLLHPTTAFASIAPRFANTSVTLRNNLLVSLRERDAATVDSDHNALQVLPSLFADAAAHDLHLVPEATVALDQGETVADAGLDIDGNPHDQGAPDLGAHELR